MLYYYGFKKNMGRNAYFYSAKNIKLFKSDIYNAAK